MLSPEELTAWYYRLNLSPETRSVIDRVRSSQPARRVGGGCRNVSGRYLSRKMGMTIQFESYRVELAGIYEMEHDDSVEEFYDQPPSIKLDYLSAEGRHLGVMHTPDVLRYSPGCSRMGRMEDGRRASPARSEEPSTLSA